MNNFKEEPIYHYSFIIPAEAVDENRHVNNVYFVQWMQDAAMRHFESIGGVPAMQAAGGTWVVRSHRIEYLSPAYAGEEIEAQTWIADVRRVRSLRKYRFTRKADGAVLVNGETDWVFVDAQNGNPMAIPHEITKLFPNFQAGR